MTPALRWRISLAITAAALSGAVMVTTRDAPATAAPPLPSCGLPSQPSRCPTSHRVSPDLPTFAVSSTVARDGRQVVVVGTDANVDEIVVSSTDSLTGRETYRRHLALPGGYPFLGYSALTADGRILVATGSMWNGSSGSRALTIGIDIRTGGLRWYRLAPDRGFSDGSAGVATDSSGRWAYVATWREEKKGSFIDDLLTEKIDVNTGRVAWTARVGRLDGVDEFPVGVSFAGGRVVVAAEAQSHQQGSRHDYDFYGFVFDPRRGQLTARLTWGSGFGDDWAEASAVSRDGRYVAISGYGPADSAGATTQATTMLIDARRSRVVWVAHTAGPGSDTEAWAVAFSADGVVVGASSGTANTVLPAPGAYGHAELGYQATAVTLDLRAGAERWRRDVADPAGATSLISALAVAPDGKTLYWTGQSATAEGSAYVATPYVDAWPTTPDDALVLAMRSSDGALNWSSRWSPQDQGLATGYLAAPTATAHGLVVSGTYGLMDPGRGRLDYTFEGVELRFAP